MNIHELKEIPKSRLENLDLMVLLGLLYRSGFNHGNIILESRLSLSQSSRLVENIFFEDNNVRLVLNMGILSANSSLPDHILDFFSLHNDSVSFNVLNYLASRLLRSQVNMLLSEQSDSLEQVYLNGDILFTRNDNFYYSLSSFNSLFERALAKYDLNVRSIFTHKLVEKPSFLDQNTSFLNLHLGNKLLAPKIHFDITIQFETLLDDLEIKEISINIDNLVNSYLFDAIRPLIAVDVWLIVHPVKLAFLPFKLSNNTKIMDYKIKIYERYEYAN